MRLPPLHRNALHHTLCCARIHEESLGMVRRRGNPFAEKLKRLPFKALLRRDEPFRPCDADEIAAMKLSIASGAESPAATT